jgi:hypothetical protein
VVFLSPPTKLNIPEAEKLDVDQLVKKIQQRKGQEFIFSKKEIHELVDDFSRWSRSDSIKNEKVVALVMSNGPFQGILGKLKR